VKETKLNFISKIVDIIFIAIRKTRLGNEPSQAEPEVSSGLTRLGLARKARSQLGNYIM